MCAWLSLNSNYNCTHAGGTETAITKEHTCVPIQNCLFKAKCSHWGLLHRESPCTGNKAGKMRALCLVHHLPQIVLHIPECYKASLCS